VSRNMLKAVEGRIPLIVIASVDRCEDDGDAWVLATHPRPRGAHAP